MQFLRRLHQPEFKGRLTMSLTRLLAVHCAGHPPLQRLPTCEVLFPGIRAAHISSGRPSGRITKRIGDATHKGRL